MSAYAWAMLFITIFIFSMVWYFTVSPLYYFSLKTAVMNDFTSLPGAEVFYKLHIGLFPYIPLYAFILLWIGWTVYATRTKKEW